MGMNSKAIGSILRMENENEDKKKQYLKQDEKVFFPKSCRLPTHSDAIHSRK